VAVAVAVAVAGEGGQISDGISYLPVSHNTVQTSFLIFVTLKSNWL